MKLKVFLVLLCLLFSQGIYAWWDCAWQKRSKIRLNHSGATQTNAVVELWLNPSELPGYTFPRSNANDIRVLDSDDATQLQYYIEPFASPQNFVRLYVRIPSLLAGSRNINVYYNNSAATTVSANHTLNLFNSTGVRVSTRSSTTDPNNLSGYFSAWQAAPATQTGYGCSVLNNYTNQRNGSLFGSSNNILYSISTVLNVPANLAGTWGIRVGPDYGRGGALYVNGVAISEKWTNNLWWANNWLNTAQLLQGNVNLTAGRHYIVVYGAEDGADGAASIELDPPGVATTWSALNTTNFSLTAPSCNIYPFSRINDPNKVTVYKSNQIMSDPVNGSTNPKAIPNAVQRYRIKIENVGAANWFDAGGIKLSDIIPNQADLLLKDLGAAGSGPVRFINSIPASGLTYNFAGLNSTSDDLAFSTSNGSPYNYTPSMGANDTDTAVRSIEINPKGSFACAQNGAPNSATFEFDVLLR